MGREGSGWILLGALGWMWWLLLPTLKACSRGLAGGSSLGGGRRVALKLLLLLLRGLWGAGLWGSWLRAVSSGVLHAILLLGRGAWLLWRVSTRSLVLLVHLTVHASWGSLLYSRVWGLCLWRGGSRLRCCR